MRRQERSCRARGPATRPRLPDAGINPACSRARSMPLSTDFRRERAPACTSIVSRARCLRTRAAGCCTCSVATDCRRTSASRATAAAIETISRSCASAARSRTTSSERWLTAHACRRCWIKAAARWRSVIFAIPGAGSRSSRAPTATRACTRSTACRRSSCRSPFPASIRRRCIRFAPTSSAAGRPPTSSSSPPRPLRATWCTSGARRRRSSWSRTAPMSAIR
jgi:hypothetical protein